MRTNHSIIFKPHAYFQTMPKAHATFEIIQYTNVEVMQSKKYSHIYLDNFEA